MEAGCLAWIRTRTVGVKARHAAVTPRGSEGSCRLKVTGCKLEAARAVNLQPSTLNLRLRKLVEPEVVATSPYRIKSPGPVCCGFDSKKREKSEMGSAKLTHLRIRPSSFLLLTSKLVLAAGFAPALATLSTSCLFCWTTRAGKRLRVER